MKAKSKRRSHEGVNRSMKKRKKWPAEAKAWLRSALKQLAATTNPRSVMEEEALRYAPHGIIYDGGLGNPLRGFHPFAAHVRNVVGRAYRGNLYGAEGGMPELIEAAIWFSREVDGVSLTKDQVLVNEMGSCQLLGYLAEAMTERKYGYTDASGDLQVLIGDVPAYGRHISDLPIRDVRYHLIDLWEGDPDITTFARNFGSAMDKHHPKLVVLSSAKNPTTRVMTDKEVSVAVDITQDHGAVLYMDDAYRHVYREARGPIPTTLKLKSAMNGKVVTTLSPSKAHQSPGNGGLLLGNPELIEMARKVRKRKGEGGNVAVQLGFAAMLYDVDYMKDTRRAYDNFFAHQVPTWTSAGWELTMSEATIFLKAQVPAALREIGWNAFDCARLFARNGIIVYPFTKYFHGGKTQEIRICANGTKDSVDGAAEVIHRLTSDPPPVDATWPQIE